ncbi:MAG: sugar phosphate isomerase/epimerase [Anaerolineales bacterium]|nr:MAG: sugar phosphate isomerase/epimerase [Anaerolineales bacterium]
MKLALATPTPEVEIHIPVALLSGTFSERLQKAARLGYDGVELMVVRPGQLDARAIHTQISESGLAVVAIASGAIYLVDKLTLLASDVEVSRQATVRLHALIDFAAALEAPLVTIGSFRGRLAWAGGQPARKRLIEILQMAAEKGAERGVRLVLEPLNRYESDLLNNADEGLALIAEVGHSHLGLLLDTYHVNIEEASLTEPFRQGIAAGKLWHVHLGDSNRLPPGEGHLDFPSIIATLREMDYQGYLSAELLARPDPDTAAEATIAYMRQVVPGT